MKTKNDQLALNNCQGNISRSIREAKNAGAPKDKLIKFLEQQMSFDFKSRLFGSCSALSFTVFLGRFTLTHLRCLKFSYLNFHFY